MNHPSAAEFERDRRSLDVAMRTIEDWDGTAEGRDTEGGLALGNYYSGSTLNTARGWKLRGST